LHPCVTFYIELKYKKLSPPTKNRKTAKPVLVFVAFRQGLRSKRSIVTLKPLLIFDIFLYILQALLSMVMHHFFYGDFEAILLLAPVLQPISDAGQHIQRLTNFKYKMRPISLSRLNAWRKQQKRSIRKRKRRNKVV
jgi:hypothetical protein